MFDFWKGNQQITSKKGPKGTKCRQLSLGFRCGHVMTWDYVNNMEQYRKPKKRNAEKNEQGKKLSRCVTFGWGTEKSLTKWSHEGPKCCPLSLGFTYGHMVTWGYVNNTEQYRKIKKGKDEKNEQGKKPPRCLTFG